MKDDERRKAENLLIALSLAVMLAVWMAGSKVMRQAVADALDAREWFPAMKAWAEVGLAILLVSLMAAVAWVPLDAIRTTVVDAFLGFKAKRLDLWLESRGRKHVNAELCLAFVVWTVLVGLLAG